MKMKIPQHRCTHYCTPDEGIHCIPNRWLPNRSTKDWQDYFKNVLRLTRVEPLNVIKARMEEDITPAHLKQLTFAEDSYLGLNPNTNEKLNYVGYLLWVQEAL